MSVPLVAGPVQLPGLTGVRVVNDSDTDPATVTITDPAGRVVFRADLAPAGTATLAGTAAVPPPAGTYLVAISGTVSGSLDAPTA